MRYDTVEVTKLRGIIVTIQNERDSAIKARDAMAEKLGRAREAWSDVKFSVTKLYGGPSPHLDHSFDALDALLSSTDDKPAAPAKKPCGCLKPRPGGGHWSSCDEFFCCKDEDNVCHPIRDYCSTGRARLAAPAEKEGRS